MNQALRPLQCPTCGGTHITPATLLKKMNTNVGLHLVFQGAEETWSSTGQEAFAVMRGRTCLGCGYVMLFMSDDNLAKLRERSPHLTAIPAAEHE